MGAGSVARRRSQSQCRAYKLVRDYSLHKECEKNKGQDLREGHQIEFLEILEQLVVVIAGDGLHENAHEHGEREENEFDDDDGGEAREPVDGLAHRKSVVNAVEVSVALAPEQFRGVKTSDNQKKEDGAALDGLQHEVGDGPDISFSDAASEIAIVDAEGDQQRYQRPEHHVAQNIAQPQAGEREVLGEGSTRRKRLLDASPAHGNT